MAIITFSWIFPGGKRVIKTIAATAGDVVTNLSPGSGKRWLVLYGMVTIVCNGTAANREVKAVITDGTSVIMNLGFNATAFTAGQTRIMLYMAGGGTGNSDEFTNVMTRLPQLCILEAADQLRITVAAGVAGDSYSGYFVVMEIDN